MAAKSILEYEEAQRRLEQLQKDQAKLTELVRKLKAFSTKAEQNETEIENRLVQSRDLIEQLRVDLTMSQKTHGQFQSKAEATLTKFEQDARKTTEELVDCKNSIQSEIKEFKEDLIDYLEAHKKVIEQEQMDSSARQESSFKEFAASHNSELALVKKAYDRQRVVYENLKVSSEALSATIESNHRKQEESISATQQQMTADVTLQRKTLTDKVDSFEKKLQLSMRQGNEKLRAEHQSLLDEHAKLKAQHDQLSASSRSQLAFLIALVVATFGLAMVCLKSIADLRGMGSMLDVLLSP